MGALAGFFFRNNRSAERIFIERMLQKMSARTLNGWHIWQENSAAMGSSQKFEHANSQTIALFDGRLDNRADIARELGLRVKNEYSSDVELAGMAYIQWGQDCVRYFIGDFALAVWDAPKQQLFLARDPLGVKSLYYASTPAQFRFASEIPPFFTDPDFEPRLNDSMIVQYLAGEFFDPGATFYASVRQIPPAHFLIVEPDREPGLFRYQDFQPRNLTGFKTQQDYHDAFNSLFKTAVRDRLAGTSSPTGILLSGGLDSTQIAAMAETLRRETPSGPPLKPVCLLVEGFLQEEKTSLDKLHERYGTEIEMIEHCHPESRLSTFELFLEVGDTPHLDGYLTTPLLLEKLQSHGCEVVLSGYGANELSNPFEFGHLEDLLVSLNFKQLRFELNRFAKCLHTRPAALFQGLASQTLIDNAPDFLRAGIRLMRRQNSPWLKNSFKPLWSVRPAPRSKKFPHWAENKTWRALTEPLVGYGLNQMDQIAGRFSMEPRFPFLDLRLVEFFLSVPAEIKIKGGYRKSFAQNALANVVPMPVRTEDDETCFVPAWKRTDRIAVEIQRLGHYLLQPNAPVYDYIKRDEIQKMMVIAQTSQKVDLPFLWRIARLNAWLRTRQSATHGSLAPKSVKNPVSPEFSHTSPRSTQ